MLGHGNVPVMSAVVRVRHGMAVEEKKPAGVCERAVRKVFSVTPVVGALMGGALNGPALRASGVSGPAVGALAVIGAGAGGAIRDMLLGGPAYGAMDPKTLVLTLASSLGAAYAGDKVPAGVKEACRKMVGPVGAVTSAAGWCAAAEKGAKFEKGKQDRVSVVFRATSSAVICALGGGVVKDVLLGKRPSVFERKALPTVVGPLVTGVVFGTLGDCLPYVATVGCAVAAANGAKKVVQQKLDEEDSKTKGKKRR